MSGLKDILEKLYNEMNTDGREKKDPVRFPHMFKDSRDIELSAFISACFAFGKVEKILETLNYIFSVMEFSPYLYLKSSTYSDIENDFQGFVYRFVNEQAITEFLFVISLIAKNGGFFRLVGENPVDTAENIYLFFTENSKNKEALLKSNLLCDISKKSACKRLNLFFRWMVRKDNVDFGLWQGKIKPSDLIIPLDTHILRIAGRLGLTKRRNSSLKTAIDITESLKFFDKNDPVKYDFSLCHTGIQGICNADVEKAKCNVCYLKEFCIEGKIKANKFNGGF